MNGFEQIGAWIAEYLPGALAAIAILVIGWLVALIVSSIVRNMVRRTRLEPTLAAWLKTDDKEAPIEVGKWSGRIAYYLVMFFVLVAFFQSLGLTFIAEPLRGFLNQIFAYAPRLFGAVVLTLVAWLVATLLKMLVAKTLTALRVDERLGEQSDLDKERSISLVQSVANAVYWVVIVLFLPAILSALALEGLLIPLQDMLAMVLGYLPNIVAAGLIMLLAWIGARILRGLVTQVAAAVGVDRLSTSTGIASVLGAQKLSGLIGIVVYALVMILAIIAALNALALEAITAPASDMLGIILAALPAIMGAALVLFVAYLIARVVAGLVTNVLTAAGFNNILTKLGLAQVEATGARSPSHMVGYLVLVGIMLFAAVEAAGLLGFTLLADLTASFVVIVGQVVVGLIVFGIGLYLAGVVHEAVLAGGGPQAGLLAKLARIAILVLTGAMALSQMGVAQEIIVIGFGAIVGAIALTAVIAFGIGGRDLAAREMEQWIKERRAGQQ